MKVFWGTFALVLFKLSPSRRDPMKKSLLVYAVCMLAFAGGAGATSPPVEDDRLFVKIQANPAVAVPSFKATIPDGAGITSTANAVNNYNGAKFVPAASTELALGLGSGFGGIPASDCVNGGGSRCLTASGGDPSDVINYMTTVRTAFQTLQGDINPRSPSSSTFSGVNTAVSA